MRRGRDKVKQNQFTDEQIYKYVNEIIQILQEAERGEQKIGALCTEKGITQTTFYRFTSV